VTGALIGQRNLGASPELRAGVVALVAVDLATVLALPMALRIDPAGRAVAVGAVTLGLRNVA
jgi:hypothetical protein